MLQLWPLEDFERRWYQVCISKLTSLNDLLLIVVLVDLHSYSDHQILVRNDDWNIRRLLQAGSWRPTRLYYSPTWSVGRLDFDCPWTNIPSCRTSSRRNGRCIAEERRKRNWIGVTRSCCACRFFIDDIDGLVFCASPFLIAIILLVYPWFLSFLLCWPSWLYAHLYIMSLLSYSCAPLLNIQFIHVDEDCK